MCGPPIFKATSSGLFKKHMALTLTGCLTALGVLVYTGHAVVSHTAIDEVMLGVYGVGAAHGGVPAHICTIRCLMNESPPLTSVHAVIASFLLRQFLRILQSSSTRNSQNVSLHCPESIDETGVCATPRTLLRGVADVPKESSDTTSKAIVPLAASSTTEVFSIDEFEAMKKQKSEQSDRIATATKSSRATRRSGRTPTRYGEWA